MHVTSFHCKVVKLCVYCIWSDTPSAVRYEQMPKSRYYCLQQLNKERQAKRTKQTRNVQDDRIFTGKRKTSTNLNKHTTDAKLQEKPHNVKERRYDKGPMNQEKTAMKAKRTTKQTLSNENEKPIFLAQTTPASVYRPQTKPDYEAVQELSARTRVRTQNSLHVNKNRPNKTLELMYYFRAIQRMTLKTTKQKQQTNGKRTNGLVNRSDTNARGFNWDG